MAAFWIVLPGGLVVHTFYGSSVDIHAKGQLDSPDGFGGASPELPVPVNFGRAMSYAHREDIALRPLLPLSTTAAAMALAGLSDLIQVECADAATQRGGGQQRG